MPALPNRSNSSKSLTTTTSAVIPPRGCSHAQTQTEHHQRARYGFEEFRALLTPNPVRDHDLLGVDVIQTVAPHLVHRPFDCRFQTGRTGKPVSDTVGEVGQTAVGGIVSQGFLNQAGGGGSEGFDVVLRRRGRISCGAFLLLNGEEAQGFRGDSDAQTRLWWERKSCPPSTVGAIRTQVVANRVRFDNHPQKTRGDIAASGASDIGRQIVDRRRDMERGSHGKRRDIQAMTADDRTNPQALR